MNTLNNKDGTTALTCASCNGNDECVNELIKAGADVNHIDYEGLNIIVRPSLFGYFKCVELLIQAGADVNIRSKNNVFTALMAAVSLKKEQPEELVNKTTVEFLEEN